jgi:hypothetical protein
MKAPEYRRRVSAADHATCPECGAPLEIDPQAQRVDGDVVTTVCVGFCSGCEFVHEFNPDQEIQ